MKRYISSASKKVQGRFVNYTSLAELEKLLKPIYDTDTDESGNVVWEEQIQFVAGPVDFVIYATQSKLKYCTYKVLLDGDEILQGRLSRLFTKDTKPYISYNLACQAPLEKLSNAISTPNIDKKYRAALARENKKSTDEQIYNIINPYNISKNIALDAIRSFRNMVDNDDWASLTSWRLSKVDSKAESFASLPLQAYGNHYTYVIQLDTGRNTYTTNVYRSEGWHTE